VKFTIKVTAHDNSVSDVHVYDLSQRDLNMLIIAG
jgi:hypothetical protein